MLRRHFVKVLVEVHTALLMKCMLIWLLFVLSLKNGCLMFWFQGLVYDRNDTLFESTGLYGRVIVLIFPYISFFFLSAFFMTFSC